MTVHALSGFFVVASFFNVTAGRSQLEQLLAAVEAHCALPWQQASTVHGGRQHREVYCFRGVYVLHLLLQGLGVEEHALVMGAWLGECSCCGIHCTMCAAGDGRVSWTQGAALAEGHRLGLLRPPQKTGQGSWYAWLGLAVAALALVCGVQWGGAGRGGLMKQVHRSPGKGPRQRLWGPSLFGKSKS